METTTVEERLTRIEREFDELKHQILGLKPRAKDMVTHNRRHFPADRLPALKITSPKEFLHILQTAKP